MSYGNRVFVRVTDGNLIYESMDHNSFEKVNISIKSEFVLEQIVDIFKKHDIDSILYSSSYDFPEENGSSYDVVELHMMHQNAWNIVRG